jgi:hypothetical protein
MTLTARPQLMADMKAWGYSKNDIIDTLAAIDIDEVVALYPNNGWSYTYEYSRTQDSITVTIAKD